MGNEDYRILLVDDETDILDMECVYLKKCGFSSLYTASNCDSAERAVKELKPHLIVLDVMLPDGNGFQLYRILRQMTQAPILFLSARDEDVDRLIGLGLGADDYITKPFLPEELTLRITNIINRAYPAEEHTHTVLGTKTVDMEGGRVIDVGGEVALTAKEYQILKKLLENRGKIVTIDALCEAIWAEENFGYENTLMVHIRRLREKIEEDASHPRWLITVRGLGYKLERE